MNNNKLNIGNDKVCDLTYLNEIMGGKKKLIKEIIEASLEQITDELQTINDAIQKENYLSIKNIAHSMKSSVSIMGITSLALILQEIEDLGTKAVSIEKVKLLFIQLNTILKKAIDELEREKQNYN